MMNTTGNDFYRSGKTLSFIAIGFLGGILACIVLNVILGVGQLLFPDKMVNLANGQSVSLPYLLIGLVALLNLLLFLGTIIFFLIWEYRAVSNLPALKARDQEFTPGWAVGWWFVPFASLVKPYQVMSELWNESDPDFDPDFGFLSSSSSAPRIINWWWALFIISSIATQISSRLSGADISQISNIFPYVLIIASLLRGIDAFLIIKIIKTITKRQELRFQRLGSSNHLPPPPPNFNG